MHKNVNSGLTVITILLTLAFTLTYTSLNSRYIELQSDFDDYKNGINKEISDLRTRDQILAEDNQSNANDISVIAEYLRN